MMSMKNITKLPESTSKRSIPTFQLKDGRIDSSSNEVLENVVKKFERDVDDENEVKTDEGTLFGSSKDVCSWFIYRGFILVNFKRYDR